MARTTEGFARRFVLPALLVLASTVVPAVLATTAGAAPSSASSRMRSFEGTIEVVVGADAEPIALDSITVLAIQRGYAELPGDRERLRVRFEKPASLEEVTSVGRPEGTERKRLEFEVVKGSGNRLRVIGLVTLVTNPGATDESEQDMGKRQPFRDELKSVLSDIRRALGRRVP